MSEVIQLEGMGDILLFKFSRSWWQARFKMPKEMKKRLFTGENIPDEKLLSATVAQVDECPQYKAITKLMYDTYDWVQLRRAKGIFPGFYFMKRDLKEPVDAYLKERFAKLPDLVEAFVAVYPEIKETMKEKLNGAYDESFYPTPEALRTLFSANWFWLSLSIPTGNEFEESKEKLEAMLQEAWNEVNNALIQGFQALLKEVTPQLGYQKDGKPRTFRDTYVPKIREFLDTFTFRNVRNNKELEELIEKAREVMLGVTNNDLRTDDNVRKTVKETFDEIISELPNLITEAPLRKFDFD